MSSNFKSLFTDLEIAEKYQEAETVLSTRLADCSDLTGFKYNDFKLAEVSSYWGICSTKKLLWNTKTTIRLNWRLIFLSQEIQDYVCIHELCHIKYPNHSKQFWSLVESFCPNYKILRKKLKQEGAKFLAIKRSK